MFRRILTSSSMNSNHCCTFISRITNNVGPVHITIAEFEIRFHSKKASYAFRHHYAGGI